MPAPAFYLRLALLPLVLVSCRTRDNPNVCTTTEQGDCGLGLVCNVATQRCEPTGPTDVGRPESKDGPVGGMTGMDGPAIDGGDAGGCTSDAGCTADQPICSPAGRCVACLDHAGCTTDPNRPACIEGACVACQGAAAACQGATSFCSDKGACVACNASRDCMLPDAPICLEGKCTRCTADSQCEERDGADPGLCLSHQGGRCAKDEEVVYVRATPPCVPTGSVGLGTSDMPFCEPQDALGAITPSRRILLLRGQDPFPSLLVPRGLAAVADGVISVIGLPRAVILPGAKEGVKIEAGIVYLRGLTIEGGAKEGVVVDGDATLQMTGGVIKLNKKGGLLATNGAGFEVVNSIFHANQSALVNGQTPFGGAYLSEPLAGRPSVFRFNTVIGNLDVGVVCGNPTMRLSSVLLTDNRNDDQRNCMTGLDSQVGGDPKLDAQRLYWLTSESPCKDRGDPASSPPDDWKGEPRPQGIRSDCGADELHQE